MTKQDAVLFIYQHGYQRRYYQQLISSKAFSGKQCSLAFYWQPRLPALNPPSLKPAEIDSIIAFQQRKRIQRGQRPLTLLLRLRARVEYRGWYRLFKRQQPKVVAFWNGNNPGYRAARLAAARLNIPCYAFENGPLPDSTTCDVRGVNAGNSLPRDAAFYRRYAASLAGAEISALKKISVTGERQSHKPAEKPTQLPKKFYFAPFQVHEDSQLLAYSPRVNDMRDFFDWLSQAADVLDHPVVVKEHPSCKCEYSLDHQNIIFANGNSTRELIEQSSAVITINSTVGLEAIVASKPVITLGEAFYNIAGLTQTADSPSALTQRLSNAAHWQYDEALRLGFLHYLRHRYLITGDWRNPDSEHCASVVQRLLTA